MKKSDLGWWLSLSTGPFLLTYLGIQSFSSWLTQVGQASEEVFRGDRLPVLNFPEQKHEGQQYPS